MDGLMELIYVKLVPIAQVDQITRVGFVGVPFPQCMDLIG